MQRLTDASDLIVLGHVAPAAERAENSALFHGTLAGTTLLWGDPINFLFGEAEPELSYQVVWLSSDNPLSSSDGLWFMSSTPTGETLIHGWAEESRMVTVSHRLVDQMVIARDLGGDPNYGTSVMLLIRNAHLQDIQVPRFRKRDGMLLLHPSVSISLWGASDSGVVLLEPLPGKMAVTEESDWISLMSGEEQAMGINLVSIWGSAANSAERLYFDVASFGDFNLDLTP